MKVRFLILFAVWMAACADHNLPCRSVQGLWGEEKNSVVMSFAETVCDPITGTGIRVSDVADSRCPKDVYCIWAGEVQIKLDIVHQEEVIDSFTIRTNAPVESVVNQQPFVFSLKAVTPDPPPGDIKKSAYRITLEVEPK